MRVPATDGRRTPGSVGRYRPLLASTLGDGAQFKLATLFADDQLPGARGDGQCWLYQVHQA